jgi:hypothetical protein
MIRGVCEVLRPGGAVVLQVPGFEFLADFEAQGPPDAVGTVVHNVLFTGPVVGRLLVGCGLEVRLLEVADGMITAAATRPLQQTEARDG